MFASRISAPLLTSYFLDFLGRPVKQTLKPLFCWDAVLSLWHKFGQVTRGECRSPVAASRQNLFIQISSYNNSLRKSAVKNRYSPLLAIERANLWECSLVRYNRPTVAVYLLTGLVIVMTQQRKRLINYDRAD